MVKRIQPVQPQASSIVYPDGKTAYEELLLAGLHDGIYGEGEGHAKQVGANRWMTNVTIAVENIFGPLPNVNLFTYPRNRWRNFLQTYISGEGIDKLRYQMRMGAAGQGDAFFYTDIKERHQGMQAHNDKGNCLIGFSFRSAPYPAVTMYSRSSMLSPMGVLDISLGILLARQWWKILNVSTPPQFNWFSSSYCITPFHNTMVLSKMGNIKYKYTNEGTTQKNEKRRLKKKGEEDWHWPGRWEVVYPENFEDEPKMYQTVVKQADKFIRADDYEPGEVYAQYIRMQRKIRNWLYNMESINPWVPFLPDEWFSDMYGMTKAYAKDYKNQHLPMLNLTDDDMPRGEEFVVPADRDIYLINRTYEEITTTSARRMKDEAENVKTN